MASNEYYMLACNLIDVLFIVSPESVVDGDWKPARAASLNRKEIAEPPEDVDSSEILFQSSFLETIEGKVLQREIIDDSTSSEALYNLASSMSLVLEHPMQTLVVET